MKVTALILLMVIAISLGSRHTITSILHDHKQFAKTADTNYSQDFNLEDIRVYGEYLAEAIKFLTKNYFAENME